MLMILPIITQFVLLINVEALCNVSTITLELRDEIASALNKENETGGMQELHCVTIESKWISLQLAMCPYSYPDHTRIYVP